MGEQVDAIFRQSAPKAFGARPESRRSQSAGADRMALQQVEACKIALAKIGI
jgi:hypothetical protein